MKGQGKNKNKKKRELVDVWKRRLFYAFSGLKKSTFGRCLEISPFSRPKKSTFGRCLETSPFSHFFWPKKIDVWSVFGNLAFFALSLAQKNRRLVGVWKSRLFHAFLSPKKSTFGRCFETSTKYQFHKDEKKRKIQGFNPKNESLGDGKIGKSIFSNMRK